MPVPDLSSINKRVSDTLKTWLPRITDPSYLANTTPGKAATTGMVLTTPGVGLLGYGLSKLSETKLGKQALKEVDGLPNFPVVPELKITSQAAKHVDELGPLAMAIPTNVRDYLWKSTKSGKMVYDDLKPMLEKYAQGASAKSGSKISVESAAESGLTKVVDAMSDPNYDIPKTLYNDEPAALQHIIKEKGHREIDRLINEGKETITEASTVFKDKDGKSVNPVANAASDLRNPEQAILQAEKPVDKVEEAKVKLAGGIFDKLHSPKIRAMFDGIANRKTPTEIQKELAAEGIDISRQRIFQYTSEDQAANIMKPIVTAEQKGADKLKINELQKLITSQKKLLGTVSPDSTIEQLRRHGTTDNDTLTLVRRFLIGTPASKLTPGKSDDVLVKDNLLRINTELEKLFKIKGK